MFAPMSFESLCEVLEVLFVCCFAGIPFKVFLFEFLVLISFTNYFSTKRYNSWILFFFTSFECISSISCLHKTIECQQKATRKSFTFSLFALQSQRNVFEREQKKESVWIIFWTQVVFYGCERECECMCRV